MKIIHISDLHFGMQKEGLLGPFLQDMQVLKPDVVIVSGDLTQRATKEQFLSFVDFSKKLPGVLLTVPGNHDIPLYPHQILTRFLRPFSVYKNYVQPRTETQFENNELRVLGVNSVNPFRVKDGRLSSGTMKRIQSYFSKPYSGLSILFFHHNFDPIEGAHKPLENYKELISYLKTSNIDLVCAGHSHYANINLIEKNNKSSCVFLHAGSLFCNRSKDGLNSYYLLETKDKGVDINSFVYEKGSFVLRTHQNINFSEIFL